MLHGEAGIQEQCQESRKAAEGQRLKSLRRNVNWLRGLDPADAGPTIPQPQDYEPDELYNKKLSARILHPWRPAKLVAGAGFERATFRL